MKNSFPLLRTARPAWLFLAVLLAGCVTKTEVQDLVRDSNYDALMAETSAPAALLSADAKGAKAKTTAEPVVSRIEAFIAQHPDSPSLTHPLRLRQAIVYLNQKSFANADAAFAAIDEKNLHTARDLTLFHVHESLAWWFEHATDAGGPFIRDEAGQARAVMEDFKRAAASADAAPDLQDYLREARAWAALKLAGEQEGAQRAQTIKDALDLCATPFTAKEEKLLAAAAKLDRESPPFDRSLRLALRLDTLLDQAAKLARDLDPGQRPKLANPAIQAVLDAKIAH